VKLDELARPLVGLVGGAVLGWSAQTLTITGRVDALERSLPRIESRLDELVRLQAAQAAATQAAQALAPAR
jgi:hypothetical protein